jgi:hypothetical protein
MPYGKLNILVLWGDDKRRELDATSAVDLLDRAAGPSTESAPTGTPQGSTREHHHQPVDPPIR